MKNFAKLLLAALPAVLAAGIPAEPVNVMAHKGAISVVSAEKTLFADDFSKGLTQWGRPGNHAGIVTFRTDTVDGKKCMLWINEKPEKMAYDTETCIGSKRFSVKDAAQLKLSLSARSTTGKLYGQGVIQYSDYAFKINWYRKGEKQAFQETRFNCESAPDKWVRTGALFTVPSTAEEATLHFGFGKPNIQKGEYAAFADIKLQAFYRNEKPAAKASFITSPLQITGKEFRCIGNFPEGNRILFSFSYGQKGKSVPKTWTPWTEPAENVSRIEPPAGCGWVRCRVTMENKGSASPVITDIVIGTSHAAPFRDFLAPVATNIRILERSEKGLKLSLSRESELDLGNTVFTIDGKNASDHFLYRGNGVVELKKSYFDTLKDGVYCLKVKIVTADGDTGEDAILFRKGKYIPAGPKVTLRKDGMTLVNGKPFFPIGLYVLKKCEQNRFSYDVMFRDLRKAGFNFGKEVGWFRDAKSAREFAETAQKYDFKLFTSCSFVRANTHDVQKVNECITALRDIPSILMWYTGDDSASHNNLKNMLDKRDAAAVADPNRIVCQADPVGGWSALSGGTPVFQPEIYPVRSLSATKDTHKTCVTQVIQSMDTVLNCQKNHPEQPTLCIHPIIQYFGAVLKDGKYGWVFPTKEELRAMTYAAIVRGAHGMIWYMYGPLTGRYMGAVEDPVRWKNLCDLAGELRDMSDVLSAEPVKQPAPAVILEGAKKDPLKRIPVYTLLKEYRGRKILYAVNTLYSATKAQFTVPGAGTVSVLYENRTVKVGKNGTFTDRFAPYAVHIYEIQKGSGK